MHVPQDRYVDVGSIKTRYWMEGEGTPVVLIHGVINCVEFWLNNFSVLAEKHLVYALDLVGHGRTDKPLDFPYRIKDFAQFITRFMDAVGLNKAHFIGHSLGAWIMYFLAIDFPTYIDKMVMIGSPGLTKESPLVIRLLTVPLAGELLAEIALAGSFEKRLKMQRKNWHDPEVAPDEMIRLIYEATRWHEIRKTAFKTYRALGNFSGVHDSEYLPVVQNLSSIKNPILLTWGVEDDLAPSANAQIVLDHCPQAQLEVFEGCGHDPMVQDPVKFNQVVLDFLHGLR